MVAHVVVLPAQAFTLLLHCLQLTILLGQPILQLANLTRLAGLRELLRFLTLGLWVALVALDLVFEPERVEDHDVGAVEDEGEEEGEAAEVHVALRVEFAGLDLHAFGAGDAGTTHKVF